MEGLSKEEHKTYSNLIKVFSRAIFQARDFGLEHPLVKPSIDQFFKALESALSKEGNIMFYIVEQKFRYKDAVLERSNPVVDRMASLFSALRMVSLEFRMGLTQDDLAGFISILMQREQDVLNAGGVEELFKQKKIEHMKLNPIKYELIGKDKKVVSAEDKIVKEAKDRVEKKMSEMDESEEKKMDMLIALLDPSLKKDTDQSVFIEKVIKDTFSEVHSIVEAINIVDRTGGEKAKEVISTITGKLAKLKEDLYKCMKDGTDQDKQELYRSAESLAKELTKQIKNIEVSEELQGSVQGMTKTLDMILDQTEAQKLISSLFRGEMSVSKKARFLKKVAKRQESSPDFKNLAQKILASKGMSEGEVKGLFEEKDDILEQAKRMEENDVTQDIKSTLDRLSKNEIDSEEAFSEIQKLIKKVKRG